jgi:hypothetical protein
LAQRQNALFLQKICRLNFYVLLMRKKDPKFLKSKFLIDCGSRSATLKNCKLKPNFWSLTGGYSRLWHRVIVPARQVSQSGTRNSASVPGVHVTYGWTCRTNLLRDVASLPVLLGYLHQRAHHLSMNSTSFPGPRYL